jgi:hypothetical protein
MPEGWRNSAPPPPKPRGGRRSGLGSAGIFSKRSARTLAIMRRRREGTTRLMMDRAISPESDQVFWGTSNASLWMTEM